MSVCTHLYYEYQVHPLEPLPRLKPYAAELPMVTARDPSLIICKKLKLVLNNYCSDFLIFSNLKSLGICKAMNLIHSYIKNINSSKMGETLYREPKERLAFDIKKSEDISGEA